MVPKVMNKILQIIVKVETGMNLRFFNQEQKLKFIQFVTEQMFLRYYP